MTIKNHKAAAFNPAAKITILAKGNPKREGTKAHKLFGIYKAGMTVAQYQTAVKALKGVRPRRARSSLRYDVKHKFVKLAAPAKG